MPAEARIGLRSVSDPDLRPVLAWASAGVDIVPLSKMGTHLPTFSDIMEKMISSPAYLRNACSYFAVMNYTRESRRRRRSLCGIVEEEESNLIIWQPKTAEIKLLKLLNRLGNSWMRFRGRKCYLEGVPGPTGPAPGAPPQFWARVIRFGSCPPSQSCGQHG